MFYETWDPIHFTLSTQNQPTKTSTLPDALNQFQQKSVEAIEFVRANSISGLKARDRVVVEDRRPKIQLSLKYNGKTKTLSVVVHKIKNLVCLLLYYQCYQIGIFRYYKCYQIKIFSVLHVLPDSAILDTTGVTRLGYFRYYRCYQIVLFRYYRCF